MKLLTFRTLHGLQLGVKTDRGILDVAKAAAALATEMAIPQTIDQVLDGNANGIEHLENLVSQALAGETNNDYFYSEEELNIGPCVPNPGKIICVGLNYRKHAEESNMAIPTSPVLFNKFKNAIAAHGDTVSLPTDGEQFDYEAELAIVIGKKAKHVEKEHALDYVFGYCNANDLSARDLQFRTSQWLLGKACDGFSPIGPYLVTANEVGNPNELAIRCYLNGQLRQDSNTADMIFYCDEIVSYLSRYMTLEPGDLILTGTPEGVIMGYPKEQQVWLREGDEVTIEIEKLGRLTNRIQNEA
ncbi:fumarylacetoacetate hydrolase family protein [Fodinisporobacter ferrooxydans]|uniref:Fumarylacetoacetate hydrolase family protein n=1 Tax=Fodinisporobacter ferrooxydans TaxID=2901836 RepID=A0ABY4CPP2_9BACL|nr:fumarylacetoacetate hydrolase family protein [Alicyclobacillaceae bacterium MYW30-H2]